ncbi:translation elongation factor Ts ['Camptotheca acuminata' phytoplasma]|uniref:translation elongation factor Ts n=1 Tax='Camptotheca acuminata' phytoplasma TaxID=3239192 RepID=UPI00351A43BF
MKITIELIKQLRDKTQVGIADCKKALEQTNGNFDDAVALLKKKSLYYYKTQKTKDVTEGLTNVIIDRNKAVLYEINAETDFVVMNSNFQKLFEEVGSILLKADPSITTLESFLNFQWEGKTVKDLILEKSFVIKEQIVLSRIQVVYKKDEESFGFYKHQGGKISSLVRLDKVCPDAQEHLPVHIAGMKPQFLNKETVDKEFLNEKRNTLLEQIKEKNINKPLKDELMNQIVKNMLNATMEKICFLEQPFYMDTEKKVSEYLAIHKTNIIEYYFFEVGKK